MARSHFRVLPKNPNPTGACLCSTSKLVDCVGPYICFTHTEMLPREEHPVLCVGCAVACAAKASPPPGPVEPQGPLTAELPPAVRAKVAAAMRALDTL